MRLRPLTILAAALMLAGCAADLHEEEPELEETEQWALNQWALNGFMLNSLMGTAEAIFKVAHNELASATYGPGGELPYVLNHGPSREFMKYLASCALASNAPPVEFDDVDGNHHEFRGGLGLCPGWAFDADGPDTACLELVSACMLARNNKAGKSVALSLRGTFTNHTALKTAKQLPGKDTDIDGNRVASYGSCVGTQSGPARNCGWNASRSLIGTCTPGTDVTLNCAQTGSAYRMVARVVDGIQGRDHGGTTNLAEGTVCDAQTPSLSFECGPDGSFVAMTGPVTSGVKYYGTFSDADGGVFPDDELDIFWFREGAFYGNLFDHNRHNSLVSVTTNSSGDTTIDFISSPPGDHYVFQDAWACHDPEWTLGAAYMHDRLCAVVYDDDVDENGPDSLSLCAAESLGSCQAGFPLRCASDDGLPVDGDWDYDDCRDEVGPREYPLTTVLHQPCDLVPDGHERLCEREPIIQ